MSYLSHNKLTNKMKNIKVANTVVFCCNVSTVVGNKVTKTVFEKKCLKKTTVENKSGGSERAPLSSLDTLSSELS